MSAEDIQTLLHMSPTVSSEEIAKIFTHLQGLRDPLDEDFSIEFGVQADETRLRKETHTIGVDITKSENRTRAATRTGQVMIRKIAQPLNFYPLVHVENSFSGVKFPANDTKFGGRVDADATGYITIADKTRLNPTGSMSVGFWGYFPDHSAVGTDDFIYLKSGQYSANLRINLNTIRFNMVDGVTTRTKDITFTPNTWNHYVVTFKNAPDNRFRVYKDKVQDGADITTSGNQAVTANTFSVLNNNIGSTPLPANSRLAWLSFLNAELTQTQINNLFDGILDTDACTEFYCITY